MAELLAFRDEHDDSVILVETSSAGAAGGDEGMVTRGRRSEPMIVEAGRSLDEIMGRLGPVVRSVVAQLREAADFPDEIGVEFAVKISADSNLVIARAGGEANFRVSVRWLGRGASDGRPAPEVSA
ncbi:hypothetical protein FLP10_08705 [Agromyces intestinalis]|uniref:Trypsin-co-occurring domain-containing protein n=1 Tax=Agromyces intestinalis TaxID=2592652 RepID=A0A5C1YHG9_9MICO|nr:CU044_2847 family protein [Agromyces intestinalis]QEO14487.1 hypothetical protein FLP10_08705 [Agromyces intestinalis]